ncbi:hypothetical protein AND_010708 [Anopheles darlingi]|uniref:Uncharacterized protein n=1 Tax=Anopheles darlingi TaxID=43151 RepID=W5J4D5_ANODA|nr:hypothetical protein AND_010708 [Anopheles darlingi]
MKLSVVCVISAVCLVLQLSAAAPVEESEGLAPSEGLVAKDLVRPVVPLEEVQQLPTNEVAKQETAVVAEPEQKEDVSEKVAESGVSSYVDGGADSDVALEDAAEGTELVSNLRFKRSVECTEVVDKDGVKQLVCDQDHDAESSDTMVRAYGGGHHHKEHHYGHKASHGSEHGGAHHYESAKGYGHKEGHGYGGHHEAAKGYGHKEGHGYGGHHEAAKGHGHKEGHGYGHHEAAKGYGHKEAHGYGHHEAAKGYGHKEAHGYGGHHEGGHGGHGYGHKEAHGYGHKGGHGYGGHHEAAHGYGGHGYGHKKVYRSANYEHQPAAYGEHAAPVKCGANLLVGCAPTVAKVPCQPVHHDYGGHGSASELAYSFAVPEPVPEESSEQE